MMSFVSIDARFVRIGLVAVSLLACSAFSVLAQAPPGLSSRILSTSDSETSYFAQPKPLFNDRFALVRTPSQRLAFDNWRSELRQAALQQMNTPTGAGRVWNPASQPAAAQKAGAVTIFTVNSDFDEPDSSPGDGSCHDGYTNGSFPECTLRAAIQETNATPGTDLVIIQIDMVSVARGAGETVAHNTTDDVWTLFVNTPAGTDTFSVLPPIMRNNVLIDATMQLDGSGSGTFDDAYCGNPVAGDSSIIKVALDGSMLAGADAVGLEIQADNVEIRGLAVKNFPSVGIFADGAANLKVTCSYLGTDHYARVAEPNGTSGLAEQAGSSFRFTRSIASGNSVAGVIAGSRAGQIDSSYFGLDVTGLADLGNDYGLWLSGDSVKVRQVFAGGNGRGLYISGDSADVQGSLFGVGSDSATAIANSEGIYVSGDDNFIGGFVDTRVVASGNTGYGILLTSTSEHNMIAGVIAGADPSGMSAIPNNIGIQDHGISNLIGQPAPPPAPGGPAVSKWSSVSTIPAAGSWSNLISGNTTSGIAAYGTTAIVRSFIGVNAAGTAALANGIYGVNLAGGVNHQVGGNFGNGNLISGNGDTGVRVGDAVSMASILGNYIGPDVGGSTAIGNGLNGGIVVFGDNTNIGSGNPGERNVVSGHSGIAISIAGTASTTRVRGNYIGTNASGTAALANGGNGVFNLGSATEVGGDILGEGNVISGNGSNGVNDEGIATVYYGNLVGTNAAGDAAIPNGVVGIYRLGASTVIGGDKEVLRNVISGNNGAGMWILSPPSSGAGGVEPDASLSKSSGIVGHLIQGNLIGVGADSVTALGNGAPGVWIDSEQITLVGGSKATANIIAYNQGPGVRVDSTGIVTISHNRIFNNVGLGIDLLGNGVTANDGGTPPDTDTGPNLLQNFPVLTGVTEFDALNWTVNFDFESTPSSPFRFDYYVSPTQDGSGYGEGALWLGFESGNTDASGDLSLGTQFSKEDVPAGSWVTVTATDNEGRTSEFSAAFQAGSAVALSSASVFLEGPYAGGSMSTALNTGGDLPLAQPYVGALFNGTLQEFDDAVSVVTIPTGVVDWVVLSLRSSTAAASEVGRTVAFVKSDGSLVDTDDNSDIAFAGVTAGSYYLVVCHRNHICAMSSSTLDFSSGSSTWNFTTALGQAYSGGGAAMKDLGSGVYGLFAADNNADGNVTAPDFNQWNAETSAGATGYIRSDHNLDGISTAPDFNLWNANTSAGAASQVPN